MKISKFKSIRSISVKHERGEDFIQIEGTVISLEDGRVYLQGLMFNFNISVSDFNSYNLYKA